MADLTRPSVWLKGLAVFLRHDKTREGMGVLAMAAAILTLAGLATFDPQDPSFFTYVAASEKRVQNAVGRVGAEVAGDLLGVLGLSALLIPPALFLWGWGRLGGRLLSHRWRRALGVVLAIPSISLLASVLHHLAILPGGRVERPGGFVGDELFRLLSYSLGTFGMMVLALATLALAVICLSERSLLAWFDWPSAVLGRATAWVHGRVSSWKPRKSQSPASRIRTPRPAETPEAGAEAGLGPAAGMGGAALAATASMSAASPPAVEPTAGKERTAKETLTKKEQQAFEFLRASPGFIRPSVKLLDAPPGEAVGISQEEMVHNSRLLEKKLLEFGVEGRVTAVNPGPVITSYELEPGPGIKINRIVALADDLALGLKAMSVRVVAPIPGKAAVGVEIPNQHRATVHLREVLSAKEFANESLQLPLALGKDAGGAPVVADLAQMPHLLIAGETGSGKSVCISSLILSLLFRAQPKDVRLLLIDPKRVELSVYNGIPHLADKVVTDPKDAARRLQRVVEHMEERYKLFAQVGARNLQSYNRRMALEPPAADELTQGSYRGPLPMLVVVIDELADLIMTSQAEVENAIMRLAQMARAVGIHLVVATQRPSVDVLTGVIKANFPARISFRVASKVDSRTILDMNGAEALLGKGDMLFVPPGSSKPVRIHGCNVSEVEIRRLVEFLSGQPKPEEFVWRLLPPEPDAEEEGEENTDELYRQAVEMVVQTQQASISMIQRRLRVGFNRAARMIERMEREGVVSAMDGTRPREVLVSRAADGS
ncbi:MAG: DNA translocase FtsK [candidate division NC10 bacterium]|nr:DNA translocase FtsK [candidate division NC10 bacterium]